MKRTVISLLLCLMAVPFAFARGLKSGVSVTDGLRLSARQIGVGVEPVGASELRPEIGRFGNVIYSD